MQAIDEPIPHFLNKNQQFTIPIFQRKYNWGKKQCKQLFDDILMIGKSSDETHFLGSIVHLDDKHNIIPTYRVIDGQQRLTTLTLLISALAKFLKQNPDENISVSSRQLINNFLINPTEEGGLEYKLKLNEPDNKTLHRVIEYTLSDQDAPSVAPDSSQNIWDNFNYFFNRIEEEDNVQIVFDGFMKLSIIVVSLKEHLDNPQLIFESLNSKGVSLSKSDLIRNYVLMGLNPNEQDKLYQDYWFEMEQLFDEISGYSFDKFIKDYLTTKENKIPSEQELYNEFKRYAQKFYLERPSNNKFENIKALTKDIFKYFEYFEKIYAGKEDNDDLKRSFKNMYKLGTKTITPFFLHLYADYNSGLLKLPEFLDIINTTESYLFRRNTLELSNQSLKTIYAKAYEELDKNHYLYSYQLLLLNKEGETRFPDNREFGPAFETRKIYKKTKIARYALERLENYGHENEPTPVENYTIEHILPQREDLSDEWKEELGPEWKKIQEEYLHTIGNLTFTGYNAQYSYLPFKKKRDMENGFKDSPIRLNQPLKELDRWDKTQIQKRARDLREQAYEIWPYPEVQTHLN